MARITVSIGLTVQAIQASHVGVDNVNSTTYLQAQDLVNAIANAEAWNSKELQDTTSKKATMDKLTFMINDNSNTASVKALNTDIAGEVVIPKYVKANAADGYDEASSGETGAIPVTSIGNSAFNGCSSLASITIPEGVTSIGNYAFSYCSDLTIITIPSTVTSIGEGAFRECRKLTSITILGGVTSIPKYVFYECRSLTNITIPEGVESIKESAFGGCISLTSVNIPSSVKSIEALTFCGCSSLTSITIPSKVMSIGGSAFKNCYALAEIYNFSPSLAIEIGSDESGYIGKYAKIIKKENTATNIISGKDDENLQYYVDNTNNPKIKILLVPKNRNLTKATIDNNCTKINEYAFCGCSSLTSITIPSSVTSIGGGAFYECSGGLETIEVDEGNTIYTSKWNGKDCNAIIEKSTKELIVGCKNTWMPEDVTSIGDGAFKGCSSLKSITIPNKVISIKYIAFDSCSSLTSVTIPSSVTSIGSYAFDKCSNLATVIIDSEDIAKKLTKVNVYGNLILYAKTIKIKEGINSVGSYVTGNNFTRSSTVENGYWVYTKNK